MTDDQEGDTADRMQTEDTLVTPAQLVAWRNLHTHERLVQSGVELGIAWEVRVSLRHGLTVTVAVPDGRVFRRYLVHETPRVYAGLTVLGVAWALGCHMLTGRVAGVGLDRVDAVVDAAREAALHVGVAQAMAMCGATLGDLPRVEVTNFGPAHP